MKIKFGIDLNCLIDFPYFFVLVLGVSIIASISESRRCINSDLKVQGICSVSHNRCEKDWIHKVWVKLKMENNKLQKPKKEQRSKQ